MYHSITFGTLNGGRVTGANTWEDWHLIPSSRPTVALAPPNLNFVDIPGRKRGPIDMSDYLTGGTTYGDRSGSFEFYVDNDHENWVTLRDKIISYLHGKKMMMSLEDDPDHYYEGRFSLNEWRSESWNSMVVINYVVRPKNYSV